MSGKIIYSFGDKLLALFLVLLFGTIGGLLVGTLKGFKLPNFLRIKC